mmetsp:Transcript_6933/g.23039  ORF Transcript_6933/g.23039 Transcript_6933/m.23039 type:complete len:225 (-) Transcript_6933:457-1131(-)
MSAARFSGGSSARTAAASSGDMSASASDIFVTSAPAPDISNAAASFVFRPERSAAALSAGRFCASCARSLEPMLWIVAEKLSPISLNCAGESADSIAVFSSGGSDARTDAALVDGSSAKASAAARGDDESMSDMITCACALGTAESTLPTSCLLSLDRRMDAASLAPRFASISAAASSGSSARTSAASFTLMLEITSAFGTTDCTSTAKGLPSTASSSRRTLTV